MKVPFRETPRASAAFGLYCALGPSRSLMKLSQAMGRPTGYTKSLQRWSLGHRWQDRVRLYDQEQNERLAEEIRQKQRDHLDKMNERHIQIGITQQLKALELIAQLANDKEFTAQVALQLLKFSTDLERQARGEPLRVELSGPQGSPFEAIGQVAIYLPQKEAQASGLAVEGSPTLATQYRPSSGALARELHRLPQPTSVSS